jgi:hypothetical protein
MALTPTTPTPTTTAGAIPAGVMPQLQQLGEVVVEQVPARLAQLARTIILSGTITAQQPGGALVLRTQVGELIIRSQSPLPLDKVLTLQIPPGAPPVRAQVSIALPLLPAAGAPATPTTIAAPPGAPIAPPTTGTPVGSPISTPVVPGRPLTAPPIVTAPPTVPVAPLSAALTAQAVTDIPIIPGTVLPAQVMALPDPTRMETAQRLLPPALQMFVELQKIGAPALQALLPQGLAEVVRRLPPAVLAPPLPTETNAPAARPAPAPVGTAVSAPPPTVATPAAALLPTLSAPTLTPAFASLPILLTLPPGAQVTVQVEQVFPPGQPPRPTSAPSVPLAVPTAPAFGTAVPPPASPLMPASIAVTPAAAPPPFVAPPSPTFPAVVIGQSPQGEPLATSPAGLMVLANRAPLPPGTLVELSLVHVQEPAVDADVPLPQLPRDWSALHQALSLMPNPPPGVSARLARPENLGGVTAFLIAALKLNDGQRFVGEEMVRALRERGQTDLLGRVIGEFAQAGQGFNRTDAPPTEWRSLALPVPADGQLTRLAVHLRSERDAQGGSAAPMVKRLVVEVELSRLGPLLLDGYIRPKRFDMTLRSQRRLPKALKDELRLAYSNALTALSWQGGMEFHTAAELWLGR